MGEPTDSVQNTTQSLVSKEQVIEALKLVEDPELFLDIWFLGLIYDIDIQELEDKSSVKVALEMTFTSPMCPAGPLLIDKVKTSVGAIAGVKEVAVKIVFNPPWVPSDEVKGLLGLL